MPTSDSTYHFEATISSVLQASLLATNVHQLSVLSSLAAEFSNGLPLCCSASLMLNASRKEVRIWPSGKGHEVSRWPFLLPVQFFGNC